MRFFEEYPEFNGYDDPPYLYRIRQTKPIPNNRFTRSLLRGSLKRHKAAQTLLDRELEPPASTLETSDWTPYKSPYISEEEAGIRAAYEMAKMEKVNRELLLIARENYDRLYEKIRGMSIMTLDEDVRVLLLPKLLEKMIQREKDPVKRFHQEFLMNSLLLWESEDVSSDRNTNFLYYPYHMILDYRKGNDAHKTHLRNFLNDNARKVIENRLINGRLFSDHKEYFDFTRAHPSDWHSAAHQNTLVKHGKNPFNIDIPQFQALGDYSLGALAKGYTMPAGDGKHYICITNAYSFVNDSFDFNGFFQWLGNWDFENGDFAVFRPLDLPLFNYSFRNFAKRTKHGRDFRIVSPLYEIPKQELEFKGKEIIDSDICWKFAK